MARRPIASYDPSMTTVEPGGMSRRRVLQLALTGAGVVLAGPALVPAAAGAATTAPSTLADFAPHVGTPFYVTAGRSGTASLTLLKATAIPAKGMGRRPVSGEAFSLLFGSPSALPGAGDIYTVRHAALGLFTTFVVPLGGGRNDLRYEAVYNRHTLGR